VRGGNFISRLCKEVMIPYNHEPRDKIMILKFLFYATYWILPPVVILFSHSDIDKLGE
jgi:hypothetical protein